MHFEFFVPIFRKASQKHLRERKLNANQKKSILKTMMCDELKI